MPHIETASPNLDPDAQPIRTLMFEIEANHEGDFAPITLSTRIRGELLSAKLVPGVPQPGTIDVTLTSPDHGETDFLSGAGRDRACNAVEEFDLFTPGSDRRHRFLDATNKSIVLSIVGNRNPHARLGLALRVSSLLY